MIRLNAHRANWSIDLGGGAVLHLRPIDPADVQLSRSVAANFIKGTDTEAERTPLYRAVLAEALLSRLLQSWDGIGNSEGEPIDVTRDASGRLSPATQDLVKELLSMAQVFPVVENALTIPLFLQATEKNASSPSRSGTSGARTRAKPIANSVRRRAKNALTS